MRYIKSFGLFWKDFLIGDCPEIFLGAFVVLGGAFAVHSFPAAAAFIVPALVVLLLVLSFRRAVQK